MTTPTPVQAPEPTTPAEAQTTIDRVARMILELAYDQLVEQRRQERLAHAERAAAQ